MFSRILIANRGEIAVRIIRAAHDLGVEAVAVYSTADKDSKHVKIADQSICIGPPAPADSYLNIARIIAAAEVANVDAIHPGYGFLAENAHFAEVCRSCNIEFIGPSVESMRLLGDKVKCKQLAIKNKVPTSPGSKGKIEDEAEQKRLRHIASRVRPEEFGVIVRTQAEGADYKELEDDVKFLMKLWRSIQNKAQQSTAPALLHEDLSLVFEVVRDTFSEETE